jgi:hypothetical protein
VRSSLAERDSREERVPPRIWSVVLLWGEIPFLAAVVFGELLAFVQYAFGDLSLSPLKVLRVGGLYFYAFNHVRIQAEATRSGINGAFFSMEIALLTVTAVAIYLLFRGGAEVGGRISRAPWVRGMAGAAVAVPYAALSLMVSYAVPITFPLPAELEGGLLRVTVSHAQAALWPLSIGLIAGFAGGLLSGRDELDRSLWGSRVASALAGGWRMLLYGLSAAFVSLLVLGAVNPSAVREYLDDTAGRGLAGADLLAHHVLALPNQSMWVLVPALGACDRVTGAAGHEGSEPFLCYSRFPRHGEFLSTLGREVGSGKRIASPSGTVVFSDAPVPYLLFLLVPLTAAVGGGAAGARRGSPESRGEAAILGASGGVVFAALVAALSIMAGLVVHLAGGGTLTVGPDPVGGALLALAWGVFGGAVGGALAFSERSPREHRALDRLPGHLHE